MITQLCAPMFEFNIDSIFNGISFTQVLIALIGMVLAGLFGFFVAACIFYPMGYKQYVKDRARQLEEIAKRNLERNDQNDLAARMEASRKVEDTFDKVNLSNADMFDFDDGEEDDDLEFADELDEEETPASFEGVDYSELTDEEATARSIPLNAMELEDPIYAALVQRNQNTMLIINRSAVLGYAMHIKPLSSTLPVTIAPRDDNRHYDLLGVAGYTFAIMFAQNNVVKLFMRMHAKTYNELSHRAEGLVAPATAFGSDWYGWIVTDIPQCNQILAKTLDMSYKYVAVSEFSRGADGIVQPKGEGYELGISKTAGKYHPDKDPTFVYQSERMNKAYKLEYYSKHDVCTFARKLANMGLITTQDYLGGRPAILKTNDHIFAIVYENSNAMKIVFRASAGTIERLKAIHPYVGESRYPRTKDWQWYYANIDLSFDVKQIQQLIAESCHYVYEAHGGTPVEGAGEVAES